LSKARREVDLVTKPLLEEAANLALDIGLLAEEDRQI